MTKECPLSLLIMILPLPKDFLIKEDRTNWIHNKKRNLKIVIDLLNRIKDKFVFLPYV